MYIINFFGILLLMLLLSNIINKIIPSLSIPLIQMTLGILVHFIPWGTFSENFVLNPDLFFLLFLAPLIYYEGTILNIKAMLQVKWPILSSAIVLVIVTVVAAGFFVNLILPTISLVVCFILISALAPTDSVSVMAVAKRVPVSPKLMNILAGESVMNDASGITMFQLSLAVATTGVFSLFVSSMQFVILWAGGIITGVVFIILKYFLLKALRNHGAENITFRILVRILTPFWVFMLAEAISVSGILAVLSAGITHAIVNSNFDPRLTSLHNANKNVWDTIAFTLEGLVFLLLGTQLPTIIGAIMDNPDANLNQAATAIIGITLFFAASRFLWWVFSVRKSTYQEPDKEVKRIRSGIIFSLAGARGTVTLASVMSIPVVMATGEFFPNRDMIIAIASGVIIISMLITNFLLPLFVENTASASKSEYEKSVYTDIITAVINTLYSESTRKNSVETAVVMKNLNQRLSSYGHSTYSKEDKSKEIHLLKDTFKWQREYIQSLKEKNEIDASDANYYLYRIDILDKNTSSQFALINKLALSFSRKIVQNPPDIKQFKRLRMSAAEHILEKLKTSHPNSSPTVMNRLITYYSIAGNANSSLIAEITLKGLQKERELLQVAYDEGKISWDTKRETLRNIMILEDELKIAME